ncbi:Werner syndrome ATP-dependent helicase homolog [Callorhinchus milii]|uniref:Werner syndrome ATP-dependent helicase homolog n=1 Tax=Callorhinchus milii TaxID=7868 RepID=UPI001C3FD53D|nr:Werner syndrome ATP-dependent helicase homolog [Callorhinchus milii]
MNNQQRNLPDWMGSEEGRRGDGQKKDLYLKKNILEDTLPFLEFPGSIVCSYEANDCSFLSEDMRLCLPEGSAVGFDIEWPPSYMKGKAGKVALVQLCPSEKKCYLFHVSSMSGFPSGLKRLLQDEAIKKVGVGIECDQWKLMSDCDVKLKGFVELTDMANKKLQCAEKWSLNGLVKHLFKKRMCKDDAVRCSGWDQFPLSDEQQHYAAIDAYAGLLIYQKLNSVDVSGGKLFGGENDQNLLPSMLRTNLKAIACQMQKLADLVPDTCVSGAQRVTDVLNDISERVSDLRNLLLESTLRTCREPGNEVEPEVKQDYKDENTLSKDSLGNNHKGSGSWKEWDEESTLANSPSNHEETEIPHSKSLESIFSASGVRAEPTPNKDNIMSLEITEYELQMLERQAEEEDAMENAILSSPIKARVQQETDVSYLIESDEELESEMLKYFQDLCPEAETKAPLKNTSDSLEEFGDDEEIKEEEDKWDLSIPEPNAKLIKCLKTYFGHCNFKPVQWKVIFSVLQERKDNLVVMATGYGKSLCYQFPPVYVGGIAIVISPLISLMEDQVLQLKMSNIEACFLGSSQSENVYADLKMGQYKVVYMTPEFCSVSTLLLKELNDKVGITLVAVDEAHCIAEWGHDFRNSYRKLGILKSILPKVPFVALTATASPSIRRDIAESLNLNQPQITCTSFDRPNLYLEVMRKSANIQQDLKLFLIKNKQSSFEFEGSTIIYCPSRKMTEQVTAELYNLNVSCDRYHAGMGIKARREVHHKFMRDEIQCIVATVAFGMGINKPDIRNVIHYGAPKEMESYYQEIGRAGRDGLPSTCYVLWSPGDMVLNRHLLSEIHNPKFREYKMKLMANIEQYLTSFKCRRTMILSHFEDKQLRKVTLGILGTERCCDNCRLRANSCGLADDPQDELQDFGKEARQLLSAVSALGEKCGLGVPVLLLRGSHSQRLPIWNRKSPLFGIGKDRSETWWKALGRQLIFQGFLQEDSMARNKFAVLCHLSAKGRTWLTKATKESHAQLLLQPTRELFLHSPPKAASSYVQSPTSSVRSSPLAASAKEQEFQRKSLYQRFARQKEKETENLFVELDTKSHFFPSPASGTLEKSVPSMVAVSSRELELQGKLYAKLLTARQKIASEKDVPPAMLATNKILLEFAKIRPTTADNLKRVDGVPEAKSSVLAPLLVIIKGFCEANELEADMFSLSNQTAQQKTTCRQSSGNNLLPVLVHLVNHSTPASGYPVDVKQAGLACPVQESRVSTVPNPLLNSDINSMNVVDKWKASEEGGEQQSCSTKLQLPQQMPSLSTSAQEPQESEPGTKEEEPDWIEKTGSAPTAESSHKGHPHRSALDLASWNQLADASTQDLFDDSQTETCSQSGKRKLPNWFASCNKQQSSSFTSKKVKKQKGLFN